MNAHTLTNRSWTLVTQGTALSCLLLLAAFATTGISSAAEGEPSRTLGNTSLTLAPNAPDTYIVKKGDTLWDISATFLSNPWLWPDLWQINSQIKNPHLIYPGDVLSLVFINGQPRLTVTERTSIASGDASATSSTGTQRLSPQIYSEPLNQPVTALPYKDVAVFLGRPSVIQKAEVKSGPYVLSIRNGHMMASTGNEIYARGIANASVGTRFNVLHVGQSLSDPESGDTLGYYAEFIGSAVVISSGDPATLQLVDAVREVLPGDKLFAENTVALTDFVPHSPTKNTKGVILSVNESTLAGKHQVVAINRGKAHGIETGHVLSVNRLSGKVADVYSDGRSADPMNRPNTALASKVTLPSERIGHLMVFKTFDSMSYALVMDASHPISIGDQLGLP